MRLLILCGMVLLGLAQPALAADLPILRGTSGFQPAAPSYVRWGGVYVGGQGSYSASSADFTAALDDLNGFVQRTTGIDSSQWAGLPRASATGSGYGGFIGYNGQWEDTVIGVELNYTRADLTPFVTDSLQQPFGFGTITVTRTDSIHLTDFGTLRVRGGWAAGAFMPYAFVGLAAGRADVFRAVPTTPVVAPLPAHDDQMNTFGFGYSLGGGVEMSVMAGLFLRAEYEFLRFGSFDGVVMNLNTVRAGAGVRF